MSISDIGPADFDLLLVWSRSRDLDGVAVGDVDDLGSDMGGLGEEREEEQECNCYCQS